MFSHQQSLLENLRQEWEPSMVLHLVTVILFQQNTNCAIHISGKLVPQVIAFLQNHLQSTQHSKLIAFEQLVIQQRKLTSQTSRGYQNQDSMEASGATREKEEDEGVSEMGQDGGGSDGTPSLQQAAGDRSEEEAEARDVAIVNQELQNLVDDLKKLVVKPKKNTSE